ncbi:MAG: hypothetical protein CM15mV8_0560 [Caudoviricetes sp.]|nr:MAG: hypothetical protein CM15mV8_0560 [Caudoviricetes sp.]
MSYTHKVIYTKPNAEILIEHAEFTNLIDSYFNAGKIIQKPTKTVDGLTTTFTTIFNTQEGKVAFSQEEATIANTNAEKNIVKIILFLIL